MMAVALSPDVASTGFDKLWCHREGGYPSAYVRVLDPSEYLCPVFDEVGTGGVLTSRFLLERGAGYAMLGIAPRQQVEEAAQLEHTAPDDFSAQVALVKDTFGRSMSRLAQVFGVSRQTLYNWLEGETPRAAHQPKLRELAAAARILVEEGVRVTPPLLERTVARGVPLLEYIARYGDGETAAKNLAFLVKRGKRDHDRLAAMLKGREDKVGTDEFVTPAFNEDVRTPRSS